MTTINDESSIPRVPDAHGEVVDEKLFSDLYIRTSWFDASIAIDQIDKGKAIGRRESIAIRNIFQSHLYKLGCSISKNAGKIVFVAILVIICFHILGFKSAFVQSNVNQLWVEVGDKLEKELLYTARSMGDRDTSANNQLIIQTPKNENASILHSHALLSHLEIVKKAISVQIYVNGITWSIKDICQSPTTIFFEEHFIEQIFENIIPCTIITPLDCFWEGSRLLGPNHPVRIPNYNGTIRWTSLDPLKLLKQMNKNETNQYLFDRFEQYMRKAGISTGYLEKPCLDVDDPECPATAPNKPSKKHPDIGAVLSGGCYGFAANYMHWPEELIVGGVSKNRSRHIKKAKALQTVVQLMGEQELYDHWANNYKVHYIGWSKMKAGEVLRAWQEKFSKELKKLVETHETLNKTYDFHIFSSEILDNTLKEYSMPYYKYMVLVVILIVIYTGMNFSKCKDPINGQCGVGIAGVVLICATTSAALGFCSFLGPFNVATTHVVPYLALGFGIDQIFVLIHAYDIRRSNNEQMNTGNILKKSGSIVLFSGASTACAFFIAALIPIPILRNFALQSAILVCFNLVVVILVFPAFIEFDLRRRRSGSPDMVCCAQTHSNEFATNIRLANDGRSNKKVNNLGFQETSESLIETKQQGSSGCLSFIEKFFSTSYRKFISSKIIKSFGLISLCITVAFSIFAGLKLSDGFELTDLIPKNTNDYKFLTVQSKLFGFYNMFAVTQGDFEYPMNQKLLHEYHEAFIKVSNIIKNDNGGLPDFWLSLFRDWLLNLQNAFDRDFREGKITSEKWYNNASDDSILAFKLLAQTGHVDNPVEKSLIAHARLVDKDGIINPKGFYNYLSAWAWNDDLGYSASQGNLRPEPRQWLHSPMDFEMKIPKSAPLTYTQIPFYLHGLYNPDDIRATITQIREICEKYENRGLPNYPSGIPFMYLEQYINIKLLLFLSVAITILIVFVLSTCILLNTKASILVVINSIIIVIETLGVMYLLDLRLSAITSTILIPTIGLNVCFTAHLTLGFITSIGNRERRLKLALEYAMPTIVHGIITSIVVSLIMGLSPFVFIMKHFMWLLLAFWVMCAVNNLFYYPVLLLCFGPEAELIPLQNANRISTPSPLIKKLNMNKQKSITLNNKRTSKRDSRHNHMKNFYTNNEPSLTTITEEPQSWQSSASSISNASFYNNGNISDGGSSANEIPLSRGSSVRTRSQPQTELQSIIVQPEVTVETHHNGNKQNTKVTATANIKVELVTTANGRSSKSTSYHSSSSSSCSNDSNKTNSNNSSNSSNSSNTSNASNSCNTNNNNNHNCNNSYSSNNSNKNSCSNNCTVHKEGSSYCS